jgi:lipopolysaccharide transport protein LptA
MAASPQNKPRIIAAWPCLLAGATPLRLAVCTAVLAGALGLSSKASAAETSRCTEDVVVNGDNVDANYKTNNIQLRNVVISQCDIRVQARSARANGLNIDSARWTFEGDVRIDVENRGNLRADQAEVEFRNSTIAKLTITGLPAEFEQKRKDSDAMARGHAQQIVYDVTGGTVSLANDAWLTDGRSDIKCPQILYDIRRQAAQCPSQPGATQRARIVIQAKPREAEAKPANGDTGGAANPTPGTPPKAP